MYKTNNQRLIEEELTQKEKTTADKISNLKRI